MPPGPTQARRPAFGSPTGCRRGGDPLRGLTGVVGHGSVGIEVDDRRDAIGHLSRCLGDDASAVAVTHERDVREVEGLDDAEREQITIEWDLGLPTAPRTGETE